MFEWYPYLNLNQTYKNLIQTYKFETEVRQGYYSQSFFGWSNSQELGIIIIKLLKIWIQYQNCF